MRTAKTKDGIEVRLASSCCCHPPGYVGTGQHLSLSATWMAIDGDWRRVDVVGNRLALVLEFMNSAHLWNAEEVIALLSDCFEEAIA